MLAETITITYTAIEVLAGRWWIGIVAVAAALVATPLVRWIAYRRAIVDRPDDLLKPHARPVAYLGGVAICVGFLVGLAAALAVLPVGEHWAGLTDAIGARRWSDLLGNPLWNLMAIALASLWITIVGLVDDIVSIAPRRKVAGQVIAAGMLLAGGVGIRMATVIFSTVGWHTAPEWVVIPLSVAMCVAIVIATSNATNLLDGLDGLCGGVTGIIALGFLALAVWLAMWARFPGTDELRVVLCLALAGAVFGFLPYNIPPASIFMGDAGSMLLGFFVATMMALFCEEGTARWFVGAWVVFALPTLDTALAVVRRLLAGKPIFAGDRSHLYDQLVDRGMSVTKVVVLFYCLAAVTGVVGVTVSIMLRLRYAMILYLVLLGIVSLVFYKLGMVNPAQRAPRRADDREPAGE